MSVTRPRPPNPRLVETLHDLLVRLSRLTNTRHDGDRLDHILDEIRSLPSRGVFEALDAAVARDRGLKRCKVEILGALAARPDAVPVIERELESLPNRQARTLLALMLPHVMDCKQREQYAPIVNRILASGVRHHAIVEAIQLASAIGSKSSAPFVSKLYRSPQARRKVGDLLFRCGMPFGVPEARAGYAAAFLNAERPRDKVRAAWGLAKIGDEEALGYLHEMLYDKPRWTMEYGGRCHSPGESLFAAMALADVHGLQLKTLHNSNLVGQVRKLVGRKASKAKRRR